MKNHGSVVETLRYTPLTNEELDSLEENHASEMKKPYYWGYVTSAESFVPDDPQLFAAATPDPHAPFAFNNGIQWESFFYDDGTIYEGTMLENFPHGKGFLSIGWVGGGGLLTGATGEELEFGDFYEGEFNIGFVHGMGKYVNRNGFVFNGEFMAGMKHGCGEVKDFSKYLMLVQSGLDPLKAWQKTAHEIEKTKMTGTWLNDYFSEGPDSDYIGSACTPAEISGVVEESEEVANQARLFRFKPDGMARIFYQEASGVPSPTLQDPLHYPYNTLFVAPGPVSQLCPLPENDAVKNEMARAQNLWRCIYDKYNIDPKCQADSAFMYALDLQSLNKFRSWGI